MITVRTARWAAMGAIAATMLLAGTASSARAQTSTGGGGGTTPLPVPAPDFVDDPNTDTSGFKAGWDLLWHGGFTTNRSFSVNLRFTNASPYSQDPDGALAAIADVDNVWIGAGQTPADHKAINTSAKIRDEYGGGGVIHYEYRLTAKGTDGNGMPLAPTTVSGGIRSYALSQ